MLLAPRIQVYAHRELDAAAPRKVARGLPAPADGLDELTARTVSTHEDIKRALAALHSCRSSLLTARNDAAMAAVRLYGARAARASELDERLADALAFCERLVFIVEGDMRADL